MNLTVSQQNSITTLLYVGKRKTNLSDFENSILTVYSKDKKNPEQRLFIYYSNTTIVY